MRTIPVVIGLLISLWVFGQNEPLICQADHILDTISIDQHHYIRFYRTESIKSHNLDFDEFSDSIVWRRMMMQSIEGNRAFYDEDDQLHIRNKHGFLTVEGDWSFMDEKLIGDSSLEEELWKLVLLDSKTTGLILAHQLYASDIDAYTIIKVDALSKPQVIFDTAFVLTSILDLDKDGFTEFIGKHPDYGIAEYARNFVPFMVLKYSDSLYLENKLTYNYNLPYKSYREYPESSITLLTKESLLELSKEELRLMRNEIFADYGYVFTSSELQAYFLKKNWYEPRPNQAIILTDWEKKNIDLIKHMESR